MPTYKMKNGKGWYCSFYIKDFTNKNKKVKKEGFRTQKEAKAYEQEYKLKMNGSSDMSFSSLYEIYLEDCKVRVKPTTVINIERYYKSYIQNYFTEIPISAINPVFIRNWQNKILRLNLSPATQITAHKLVSSIFNFGIKYYGFKKNPAKECGTMGKVISSVSFWTFEQFKKAEQTITSEQAKLMMNLLYFSGMRCGEMMALTMNDFDFSKNKIKISKNLARIKKENIIMTPKTEKSNRTVTMPDFVMNMAKSYIEKLYNFGPNDLIFSCSTNVIKRAIKVSADRAGIPKIRVHDLRHSHASLLIEMGFSPLMIAERLGHENVETTLRVYSHLYPNKQEELADKLEEKNSTFLVHSQNMQ